MAHTPGPWEANFHDGNARVMHGHETLAWILQSGVGGSISERDSNARLIATAPELLACAKALLHRLDTMTSDEFALGGEKAEREALRATLAKAEG